MTSMPLRFTVLSIPINALLCGLVAIYDGSALPVVQAQTQPHQAQDAQRTLEQDASRALNSLGLHFYERQQYSRAVSAFEDALKYDPTSDGIRTNLALALLQQGKFHRVVELLDSKANLSDQRLVTALAVANFALGRYAEAARYYEVLSRLVPNDLVLRLTVAATQELSGQPQKAETILQQLPKDRAVQAQYHVILGDAYRSQLKAPQAIAQYEKALALAPDLPQVNYRVGVLYSDLNAYERAIAAFQRELLVNPKSADANYSLGAFFLSAANDLEKARHFFEKTIQLDSGHLGGYLGLMKIELSQKKPGQALEWARRAEASGGENEELHYLKSRAFNLQGQNELAEKELKRFEELKVSSKRSVD